MLWQITDKGDQDARALADRHYTRRTIGAFGFVRNGQNLVFMTPDRRAVWVTHRPTPGKAERNDGLDAWECALFRNEGPVQSSALIEEAVRLTIALWGPLPKDGLLTFVQPDRIASSNPGFCYQKAGWMKDGQSRDGKIRLRATLPRTPISHWSAWTFKDNRGGVLKDRLLGVVTRRAPMGRGLSEEARFEAFIKVDDQTGCYLWQGKRYGGRPYFSRRIASNQWVWQLAYRVAFEMKHGPIPDGMAICHHCDTPLCVNDLHLFLGTAKDNVQDARQKGRLKVPRVLTKNLARLSPGEVRDIRHLYENGKLTAAEIAIRFSVTKTTIYRIAGGHLWKEESGGGSIRRNAIRADPILTPQQVSNFWGKVKKGEGCWNWKGSIDKSTGYGRVNIGGLNLGAHRVGFLIQNGPIPVGHSVCHSCDHRPCVRGDHLKAQLPSTNSQDMVSRSRDRHGDPIKRVFKRPLLREKS